MPEDDEEESVPTPMSSVGQYSDGSEWQPSENEDIMLEDGDLEDEIVLPSEVFGISESKKLEQRNNSDTDDDDDDDLKVDTLHHKDIRYTYFCNGFN